MELLSKISVKTVFGTIAKSVIPTDDSVLPIMRVIGLASGVKNGNSTYGDWTAFTGTFKAINLHTEKEYQGGKVFLPNIAESLVLGALQQSDAEAVEFAFDIGIKKSDVAQGYEYTVTPLVEAQDNDPLKALASRVSAPLPALPAPKSEKTDEKAKK